MSKSWMAMSLNRPPDTATYEGGGGAGSLEVICRLSMFPIPPSSSFALSARKFGSKRRLKASSRRDPSSTCAAERARPRSWSIGFSQNTALPAAMACML